MKAVMLSRNELSDTPACD